MKLPQISNTLMNEVSNRGVKSSAQCCRRLAAFMMYFKSADYDYFYFKEFQMEAEFTLTGITPILFHADDVLAAQELKDWREDPNNKNYSIPGDDRSPPWTWITYLYHDNSNIVMPWDNMSACLRKAGATIVIPNKRGKTFKEVAVSGITSLCANLEFFTNGQPVSMSDILNLKQDKTASFNNHLALAKSLGFSLNVKRATIVQSKHVRVRAKFDNWQVRGRVFVSAPIITIDRLKQLFEAAGNSGLGDWRPSSRTPGSYGMFRSEVELIKNTKAA